MTLRPALRMSRAPSRGRSWALCARAIPIEPRLPVLSDDLRAQFLRFFEDRGHRRLASAGLVPIDDPTLLFTSAGMVPFKPYFMQRDVPPAPRLTTAQRCFRTTDIDSVGDISHNTFF